MASSTSKLRQQLTPLSRYLPSSLAAVRFMGGGPRTFPGGLSKLQWKRYHEKKAREKEKRLLDEEKQLYQARLRSNIRANLVSGGSDQLDISSSSDHHHHKPMSPKDHIKALADRFLKPGAEDLWNEDDGPVCASSPRSRNPRSEGPGDTGSGTRKVVDARRSAGVNRVVNSVNSLNFYGDLRQRRDYSVDMRSRFKTRFNNRRNESSSTDDDDDDDGAASVKSRVRWPRFSLVGDDRDEDADGDEEGEVRRDVRRFMSSAALGKHDLKLTKRRALRRLEEDDHNDNGLSERVEEIRQEVHNRKMLRNDAEKSEEAFLSDTRFEDTEISPLTVKALTSAGFMQMTRVQEATLSVCIEGKDAFVKARAGTGKSVAFLVPAIDAALKAFTCDRVQRVPPIYVLILCPTRELASQLVAETRVLLKYHDGLDVQGLVGGTRFKDDVKRLESSPCQILVATPGRLLDHVESRSAISVRLMGLKMLILDEADHFLDLGFRKDLERIVDCLPRLRQSLLFSATVPKEVRRVSQLVLKKDHTFIDMIGDGKLEPNSKVIQSYLVAPQGLQFHLVHQILKDHISCTPDYKVLVFCTTGMVTSLMYLLLHEMRLNVREIHSRKPQVYRSRISEEFRQSKCIILISSDVSARGMNYPDVTLVIQVGVPCDREQYIHRLGRTGRADKDGEGILLLAPWEEYFLDDIRDLPIERLSLPRIDPEMKVKLDDSLVKIDSSVKEAAYHAWLGYYNSIRETGRDKTTLVEQANKFCESIGLAKPPALYRKTVLKMGLKDIPGIRIRKYHTSTILRTP